MKNTFKVIGIIAMVALIGFSMVSCSDDDAGGGGGSIDKALHGTWKGDEENGTLIIDAKGFSTPEGEEGTRAVQIAGTVASYQLMATLGTAKNFKVAGGVISIDYSGMTLVSYKYKIDGKTLTFTNEDGDYVEYKGDKQ
jgi:hypothetical protein